MTADQNLEHCVPGRWRCPKCKFELSVQSLNMGDGTVTASDKPGELCPNDGSPMWRVSYREAYEELCETANSERFAAICILERLVEDEGASLTFFCENPEGSGPDNHAVEVNDDWTGYADRRFCGRTRFDALCQAEDARLHHRARVKAIDDLRQKLREAERELMLSRNSMDSSSLYGRGRTDAAQAEIRRIKDELAAAEAAPTL